MASVLRMKHTNGLILPAAFAKDDVRSCEELVEFFIRAYSKPGDIVFDPFAGFGTTIVVAEKLHRVGYGIEYLPDRVEYIRSIIQKKEHIICGSSLELENYSLPEFDLSFTSPPYMSRNDHEEYPFAAYQKTGDGYEQYLRDIKSVYEKLKPKLKANATVIIEVSNIIHHGVMTPLAWDVAKSVGEVLTLEKEVIVEWEGNSTEGNCGFGYDHCYCLIFRNTTTGIY